MKKEFLFEKLNEYEKKDIYPFHMPGHKRRALVEEKTYSIDITEIDGFDNLHHPEGIIREMEEFATSLYGTVSTRILVNGSTAGLLSAISAICEYGSSILVNRNCHKSVFNGIALRRLKAYYLYPEICETYGINGGIAAETVGQILEEHPEIKAVLITSPSYDGVVLDVKGIAEVVHRYGIPLLVDEAHGAHLPFTTGLFPKSALELGADLAIHSLHKTLPAFTQTALLHVNSDRIDQERISKFLSIYQSTSPSYILMAGIGSCLKWLKEQGQECFASFEKELIFWRHEYKKILDETGKIQLVGREIVGQNGIFDYDVSKFIFSTIRTEINGKELYDILLKKYDIQLEMSSKEYALALTSVFDEKEGFLRLEGALKELERSLEGKETEKNGPILLRKLQQRMTLGQALDRKVKLYPLEDCIGETAGDYIYLYPPGIPLILPGEVISEEIIWDLEKLKNADFSIIGLEKGSMIKILENNYSLLESDMLE